MTARAGAWHERVVAFSCKGRGFCLSCGGRRMADSAAHLVDRVVPEVSVRQWVLSLPFALRYRLAYDAPLVREVLAVFVRHLTERCASTRSHHRGRHRGGARRAAGGAAPGATGSRSGQLVLRMGDRIDAEDFPVLQGERCASVGGVSVHANVAVPARDRRRL